MPIAQWEDTWALSTARPAGGGGGAYTHVCGSLNSADTREHEPSERADREHFVSPETSGLMRPQEKTSYKGPIKGKPN